MSYIESLRVFVRVVDLGSITSGGRDLRLTPAVASKRIKRIKRKRCQQARPRPYLPHAPGVRMT